MQKRIQRYLDEKENPYRQYNCGKNEVVEQCSICKKTEYKTLLYNVNDKPVCSKCLDSLVMAKRLNRAFRTYEKFDRYKSKKSMCTCSVCCKNKPTDCTADILGYPVCINCIIKIKTKTLEDPYVRVLRK